MPKNSATEVTDSAPYADSLNHVVSKNGQHDCALASSRSFNELTLLEQRWLDECFDLFKLDPGEDKGVAQDTILFLAKNIEWFNYAVSQSCWCDFPAVRPATGKDFRSDSYSEGSCSFDEPLIDFRERMARLSNRPRRIVRVHSPVFGQDLHHTTCTWFETIDFVAVGKGEYRALNAQFDRGDFETEITDFHNYLVERSVVTQTTAWDLSDASDVLDRILSLGNSTRISRSQSDGSRTLKCLIIDTIRTASPGSTTRCLAETLTDRLEQAVHAGQRFDDLDFLGGRIIVGTKELSDSALRTRVGDMKQAMNKLM